jgi:hypothetical protein
MVRRIALGVLAGLSLVATVWGQHEEVNWKMAQALAEQFGKCTDEMKWLAVRLSAQARPVEGQAAVIAKKHPTVVELISLHQKTHEQATDMLGTIAELRAKRQHAEELRPHVLKAVDRLEREVRTKVAKRSFEEHQKAGNDDLAKLSALAEQLRRPVSLPARLDEMERRIREFIPTVETTQGVDNLRKAIRRDEITEDALTLALKQHLDHVTKWRRKELIEWESSQIPGFDRSSDDDPSPTPEPSPKPEPPAESRVRLVSLSVNQHRDAAPRIIPMSGPSEQPSPFPFRGFWRFVAMTLLALIGAINVILLAPGDTHNGEKPAVHPFQKFSAIVWFFAGLVLTGVALTELLQNPS